MVFARTASSVSIPPAADTDALSALEVRAISALLNRKMTSMGMGTTGWFKLFRLVDADGSGLISFEEVHRLIREDLNIPESKLTDASIKSLWGWLDEDRSGHIAAGEFGHFMRLHEKPDVLSRQG